MTKGESIEKVNNYALKNSSELFVKLEGEFYPYGIIIDADETIVPYYVDNGDDFPDSKDLISDLKKELNKYLLNQNCFAIALCYLASKKISDIEYDLLVIEMTFKDESPKEEFWFIIEIDNNKHTFKVHEKIDLKEL